MAWLRNPLPYFGSLLALHPAADVLSSTDSNDGHYLARDMGNGTRLYSIVRTRLTQPAPPVPPAVVSRRWEVAFPAYPLPGDHGVVSKPELANTDSRLGPAQLLAELRTGRTLPDGGEEVVDLGLEEISNCGVLRAEPAERNRAAPTHMLFVAVRQADSSTRASCCGAPRLPRRRCSTSPWRSCRARCVCEDACS